MNNSVAYKALYGRTLDGDFVPIRVNKFGAVLTFKCPPKLEDEPVARSQHSLILENADQEYALKTAGWIPSLTFKDITRIRFGLRAGGQLRYAYTPGKVAEPNEPYALRPAGIYESIDGDVPLEIYFATDTPGAVLELDIARN